MELIKIKGDEFIPASSTHQGESQYAVMVATAKNYPRGNSWTNPIINYLCSSPERALDCLYTKPLKGEYTIEQKKTFTQMGRSQIKQNKIIMGASAFFARQVASSCQNLLIETTIVEEGEKSVLAQAKAWDMETNKIEIKQWSESIFGTSRYSQSQIEIIKQSAQSKAYRSVLLTIVPEYIWVPILEAVKSSLAPKPQPDVVVDYSIYEDFIKSKNMIVSKGITEIELLNYLGLDTFESMLLDDFLFVRTLAIELFKGTTSAADFAAKSDIKKVLIHKNN